MDSSQDNKKSTSKKSVSKKQNFTSSVTGIFRKEKSFLLIIGALFVITGFVYPYPEIAMWLGFALAGYSTIANDSIQTVGTLLASNFDKKWWIFWVYIGGLFVLVVAYSFWIYNGDVSFQRLTAPGFEKAPTTFSFLQVAAPIFLLILTRLRMPVSTTFLILSCFSADLNGIVSMMEKSLSGYAVAFVVSFIVYLFVANLFRKYAKTRPHPIWIPIQWLISGFLWSVWIMQDAANIAVYLPRQLNIYEFIGFSSFILIGLGVFFYLRGDRIQQVVTEKSSIIDIRAAATVDFIYANILLVFKEVSNVPMSTTWVFLGLLAGREIAMSLTNNLKSSKRSLYKSLRMIRKDIAYAVTGLLVSVILAFTINPNLHSELKVWIKSLFH